MIRSFFKPSALLRNRLQNSFGSALPGVLRKGGWEKAWQHRITPWDAGKATPVIQNMLLKYANLPKGNVLVVGCGAGYDAIEFAKTGYNTLGVDLAPTALRLANENARAMEMEGKKQGKLVFQQADIFNFFPDPSWGTFSIVFDYTMMAALEPSVWLKYLQRLRSLVAPDGEFVLLMFPVGDHKYGPPYAMNPDEIEQLMRKAGWETVSIEKVPTEFSHKARAGREYLGRFRNSANLYPFINVAKYLR